MCEGRWAFPVFVGPGSTTKKGKTDVKRFLHVCKFLKFLNFTDWCKLSKWKEMPSRAKYESVQFYLGLQTYTGNMLFFAIFCRFEKKQRPGLQAFAAICNCTHYYQVEVTGVEPVSKHGRRKLSTCLSQN